MSTQAIPIVSGEFIELRQQFAAFRDMFAVLAGRGMPDADKVLDQLDGWIRIMACAQEAASRAPETDIVLAKAWGARVTMIAAEARQALADAPGSIPAHEETGIRLSRVAKSAPQPVARPARRRASNPYGLRR